MGRKERAANVTTNFGWTVSKRTAECEHSIARERLCYILLSIPLLSSSFSSRMKHFNEFLFLRLHYRVTPRPNTSPLQQLWHKFRTHLGYSPKIAIVISPFSPILPSINCKWPHPRCPDYFYPPAVTSLHRSSRTFSSLARNADYSDRVGIQCDSPQLPEIKREWSLGRPRS